ncbi:hypothetical protein LGH82_30955 [Mesorhizobium sp. PAMC28654]|uniref:hypothetical protein n=1 Tax=Mesorhizobium sp. PAMC28654 TaxID=2880934 RepID=UPI001D0A2051|nr:hypothetical protein [Mesorhizobium sp. PAMC28654]UDL89428.1 hypothetical protein LGH82_30955 [Mesorhizobium sp. PAMC28654]
MDIAGTLSALAAALGVVKDLREIDGQFDKAELRLKIADISGALADARLGVIDAGEVIRAKEQEIARLAALFAYRADRTIRLNGYTYEKAEDSDRPVGLPFCPVCEQKGHLLRLVEPYRPGRPKICPRCATDFGQVTAYSWTLPS